ncbi:hypothetical protein RHS02_01369, partial [Rhizoctonia solani]
MRPPRAAIEVLRPAVAMNTAGCGEVELRVQRHTNDQAQLDIPENSILVRFGPGSSYRPPVELVHLEDAIRLARSHTTVPSKSTYSNRASHPSHPSWKFLVEQIGQEIDGLITRGAHNLPPIGLVWMYDLVLSSLVLFPSLSKNRGVGTN